MSRMFDELIVWHQYILLGKKPPFTWKQLEKRHCQLSGKCRFTVHLICYPYALFITEIPQYYYSTAIFSLCIFSMFLVWIWSIIHIMLRD